MITVAERDARQRRYDLLHHEMRLEWLRGLEKPTSFQRRLLAQSEECVANPSLAYNSVSMCNAAYVRMLDEYAARSGTA